MEKGFHKERFHPQGSLAENWEHCLRQACMSLLWFPIIFPSHCRSHFSLFISSLLMLGMQLLISSLWKGIFICQTFRQATIWMFCQRPCSSQSLASVPHPGLKLPPAVGMAVPWWTYQITFNDGDYTERVSYPCWVSLRFCSTSMRIWEGLVPVG